jgi:hypothetical protein
VGRTIGIIQAVAKYKPKVDEVRNRQQEHDKIEDVTGSLV